MDKNRMIERAISLLEKAIETPEAKPARAGVRAEQKKDRASEAARLYTEGKSVLDVSKALGVSYLTARNSIREGGANIRPATERRHAERRHAAA